MDLATILALVNSIPGILQAALTIKSTLSTTDQATLTAALASAEAATVKAAQQLEADVGGTTSIT